MNATTHHADAPGLLSVIMPVCNVEAYLSDAINSVLAQTYTNLELILVDDGSRDSSGTICDGYAAKDSRVKVYHVDNHGPGAARNIGIGHSNGSYIAFIDSDDLIVPDMYARLIEGLEQTGADIAMCGLQYMFADGTLKLYAPFEQNTMLSSSDALRLLASDTVLKNYVVNQVYRREAISVMFPPDCTYEDVWVMSKWIAGVSKIYYINFPGYYYRMRQGSIVNNISVDNLMSALKAKREVARFLREETGLADAADRAEREFMESGIRCARNNARRFSFSTPQLKELLTKITNILGPFEDRMPTLLNRKMLRRYQLLKNKPRRFCRSMKIAWYLQPKNIFGKNNEPLKFK